MPIAYSLLKKTRLVKKLRDFYDYVKYYEYSPENGNYGTDNDFLLNWTDNFDHYDSELWSDSSSGSFNGNLCSFSPTNTNYYNGHLICEQLKNETT